MTVGTRDRAPCSLSVLVALAGPSTFALGLTLALGGLGCSKPAPTNEGRELFANTCARCHSADGSGGIALYDGGPRPRNFRDVKFQQSITDEQIKLTVMNGKGSGMPAFGTMFTSEQLAGLVAQVRSFDPERGK